MKDWQKIVDSVVVPEEMNLDNFSRFSFPGNQPESAPIEKGGASNSVSPDPSRQFAEVGTRGGDVIIKRRDGRSF